MVSVVIPTYNAALYLSKLIAALSMQSIQYELIILDSESTDNTRQLLRSADIPYVSVKYSEFNHGETRNLGVKLSKNEYVILMTQDALPASNDAFEILLNSLQKHKRVAMAYGRQLPYPDTDIFGYFARLNNYPASSLLKDKSMIPFLGIKTCSCSNSFAIYRKSYLQDIGGFPKTTILGEDVTVAAQFILRDYAVAYCAEAQVFHSHNYSIGEEFRRYFDIGVFHQQQKEILKSFTRAEEEGARYVLEESMYLIKKGVWWLIPMQYVRTLVKYIGYKLGRLNLYLPNSVNKVFSMHKSFW